MGTVLRFPRHARASFSTGYRSGRSSCRETPVARSTGKTNSPGSPRFDLSSQYQTCDCVVPIKSASGFWPPAASQALRSASLVMAAAYPDFGHKQPKNLCATAKLNFGTALSMRPINAKDFAERVRLRREEVELSQKALAKAIGYSQQQVTWLEKGTMKRPERAASAVLAEALQTTVPWLLYGEGPKVAGPRFLPPQVIAEKYDRLSANEKAEITQLIENKYKTDPERKSA